MQEMLEWTRKTFPMDLDTPRMIEAKIESLLEKEKEQIIDAFDYGYHCASNGTSAEITLDGEINYNQTYNQTNDK